MEKKKRTKKKNRWPVPIPDGPANFSSSRTLLNLVYAGILALCKNSFKNSIRSASDLFEKIVSLRNIIVFQLLVTLS